MGDDSYICHIVIPSRNYEKAKNFYGGVFGWKIKEQSGTTSLDILPASGKGISAELNSEEEVVVPSIHTSNIEATLKRIEKFGGKILKDKTPIDKEAEFGCFAIFEDPDGNKMCLYSER